MSFSRSGRSSGILLHPTSLPGPFGIGDLGPNAYAWIDTLARARQKWWQILPLGPTGFGDSPYQCFSAFAGNPYLISPELLVREGLVHASDVAGTSFRDDRVDYGKVIPFKLAILRRAWENFRAGRTPQLHELFELFREDQKPWLADYGLFMALKEARRGESWQKWPAELLRREGSARFLEFTRQELSEEVGLHEFTQFLFFRQWTSLRNYAHSHGVGIIGDAPIFVSVDSADVWANPRLFLLDAAMRPKLMAGVPPDYFSQTGQLWGNPLYDWEAMALDGFAWWIARLQMLFDMVDLVRLDHFRGFCAAWQVPAGETTAVRGAWVPGPGADLFLRLKSVLGDLPIIAEDLGEITPDVYELRDGFNLPGMKVLHFGFDGPRNSFLPHNYVGTRWVVYTGTHDNDTTRGWYAGLSDHQRWFLGRYLGSNHHESAWDLLRLAWSSIADQAIAPMQDILDLGTESRMNYPGRPDGNWQWRMLPGAFTDQLIGKLADLTDLFARN